MRQLILRILALVVAVVGLFQLVIGAVPATAATSAPARPATTRSQIVAIHLEPQRPSVAARTDHELVLKNWANIRTAPTTIGNRPVGHFVWHSRFTALHRIVYGQHPYGPGSSNHWLKITSGRYRGDFVWAEGVADPRVSRAPPTVQTSSARLKAHRHPQAHRTHVTVRHHRARRRHRARRHHYTIRHYVGGGNLGCSGLEALWRSAGGPSRAAHTAASIAMAESGGRQYAHSPTNDYGYWQINGSHGPGMATYNAYGNARAAVLISGYGSNWHPWSTYTSGAYYGRC